jgi:hypothetical protein
MPAASCSASTECWAGEGEKGVGMGVQGLLPESRPSSRPAPTKQRIEYYAFYPTTNYTFEYTYIVTVTGSRPSSRPAPYKHRTFEYSLFYPTTNF